MMLSVIVPVRHDPRVDDLMETLASQRGCPDFEVLVALDGARRRPRVPAGLPARLLDLPPRGQNPARNAGVREARGDILLFTDSDCLCPPDWVAGAAEAFADSGVVVLQGASIASENTRLACWIQTEYDRYVASHAALDFRRFCNTRCFGARSAVLRDLPLPERFARGGDGAYGRMLEARGIPIRYDPEWQIVHRHPRSRLVEGRKAFAQGFFGTRWSVAEGLDLFGPADAASGPGAWLVGATRRSRFARQAAAAALLPAAAALAGASAILPKGAGAAAFSRFHRAAHLAGRLFGEAAS